MKKILQPITIAVLLFIGLTSLLSHFFAGAKFATALMNADALYLPALVNDLFSQKGMLSNWYLTPAPYFFPDFFLYALIQLFAKQAETQIAAFAALQVLLSALSVYFIYRSLVERNAGWSAALAALLLVCLAMTIGSTSTLSKDGNAYGFIFLSAFHYGAFFGQLAFFAILLVYADKAAGRKWSGLALLGLVSFLSALSDSIYVMQLTIPFVGVFLWSRLLWLDRPSFSMATLVVSAASGVLGAKAYDFFIDKPTKYPVDVDLTKFKEQVDIAKHFFTDLYAQTPIIAVFLATFYALAFAALFYWPEKYRKSALSGRVRFVLAFSFVSAAATFLVTLFVTSLSSGPRYFIPFFFWPVLLAVLALGVALPKKALYGACALLLVFACLQLGKDDSAYQDRRQEIVDAQCVVSKIRELGLTNGVAAYWDAKPIQVFSRGAINIGQYTGGLDEHRWITSERFYRKTYDFAVITENQGDVYKISRSRLVRENGPPQAEFKCGNKTLLSYGPGKLVAKKEPLRSVGDTYTWPACELQTRIGRATPACEMEKQDIAAAGHLTYGPYDRLPAGRYAFEIAYASAAAKTSTVGEWDIVLALPDSARILGKGELSGTGAQAERIKGEFTVGPEEGMEKFEVRTLARPQLDLKIIEVRIDRLQ